MDETAKLTTGSEPARRLAAEALREVRELDRLGFPLFENIPDPPCRLPGEPLGVAIARDMGFADIDSARLALTAAAVIDGGLLPSARDDDPAAHFRFWAGLLIESERHAAGEESFLHRRKSPGDRPGIFPGMTTGTEDARRLAAEALREVRELDRLGFPLLGKIENGLMPGPPGRRPGEFLIAAIARDMGFADTTQLALAAGALINEGVLSTSEAGDPATHFRCWATLLIESERHALTDDA
jgi:hypothetical protein